MGRIRDHWRQMSRGCRIWGAAALIGTLATLGQADAAKADASDGVHCSTLIDQDGDEVVLLESEWISMHLLPRSQAIINRFVFRPTGNDIVESVVPKIRKASGGGILMDCLWEQDWRFQELADKPYTYQITKNGPEEGQVVFETDIVGWVGSDQSGVISHLISNMTLRRTVTIRRGEPFFRFDFEFISNDGKAKRPTFWAHNAAVVAPRGSETVQRPSQRGVLEIAGPFGSFEGVHFVRDFNQGWSARISPERNEGIVYLMDYDDVEMLYNAGNSTAEWMYDGILSIAGQPWKGRIYILPIIGLSGVDYANEYFICQLTPTREEGQLRLDFAVTSSFEKASQVTFNVEVEHHLLEAEPQTARLEPVAVEGLQFQPRRGRTQIDLESPDPLVFNVTAFVEMPDGEIKRFYFQKYFAGEYDSGQGLNTRRDGKPVRLLDRRIKQPKVPPVPAGLTINRDGFNVFGVLGLGSNRMRIPQSAAAVSGITFDIGYCTGQDASGYALGDFPYDYQRLFNYRAIVFGNTQLKEIRAIGASVLMPWLEAGGGLVLTGGEHAFNFEFPEHPINQYLPIVPRWQNLKQDLQQLQSPEVSSHPIFEGVDLSNLPWLAYCHDIQIKPDANARVLMRVGPYPFIVEQSHGDQRTIVVASNHFGNAGEMGGKTHLKDWEHWPTLMANIVRYAAGLAR